MKTKLITTCLDDNSIVGIVTKIHFLRQDHICTNYTSYLQNILMPAVEMKNIHIVSDINDMPVAYFIWAFVSDRIHCNLINRKAIDFNVLDWNSGDFLWILDYRFPDHRPLSLIRNVIDCFPQEIVHVYYRQHGICYDGRQITRF